MSKRYAVQMVTQDAEPTAVTRDLAYTDTLEQALSDAKELAGDDFYIAIFDRETETYVE